MKIVFISDTHGLHRQVDIPACDVLVHCGDVTAHGTWQEVQDFERWLLDQDCKHAVWVAGNHDGACLKMPETKIDNRHYLYDSSITIDGITFWGSPYTPTFYDWHFMEDRGPNIRRHWDKIPDDVDVLITHGPPNRILDYVSYDNTNPGCVDLLNAVRDRKPRYHAFGHIHEGYGSNPYGETIFINASTCNGRYQPVNKPVVLELTATT